MEEKICILKQVFKEKKKGSKNRKDCNKGNSSGLKNINMYVQRIYILKFDVVLTVVGSSKRANTSPKS